MSKKYGSSEQTRWTPPVKEEVPEVEAATVEEEVPVVEEAVVPAKIDAVVKVSASGIEVRQSIGVGSEVAVADLVNLVRTANSITQGVARKMGLVSGVKNMGEQTAKFVPETGEVVYRNAVALDEKQVASLKGAVDKALTA